MKLNARLKKVEQRSAQRVKEPITIIRSIWEPTFDAEGNMNGRRCVGIYDRETGCTLPPD